MLERFTRCLHVRLAPHHLSLWVSEGWPRRRARAVASCPDVSGPAALPGALEALLVAHGLQGMPTQVWLADALLRLWTVQPPRNARQVDDVQAAVALRFQAVFDEPTDDWVIASSLRARGPFLACAWPRALSQALAAALSGHRLALVSVQPEFAGLWNHWRRQIPREAWWLVNGAQGLSLGMADQGVLVGWRHLGHSAPTDAASLTTLVQREADRSGHPMPSALAVCGTLPSGALAGGSAHLPCVLLGSVCDVPTLLGVAA